MKVLLTGATGFVGGHILSALLQGGHDVRVLVRSRERFEAAVAGTDHPRLDIQVGDICDPSTVRGALAGCAGLVHGAAMVSMRRREAAEMYRTNTVATVDLLRRAAESGLDPIIHISSAAVFDLSPKTIEADGPLRFAESGYSRSKVEAERFAQGLQTAGAPVVTIYPSGVLGPQTPTRTVMHEVAASWLRGMPILPSGINVVDVRDVARIVEAATIAGRGPRQLMAGGHFIGWKSLADTIEELIGEEIRRMVVPGPLVRGIGRIADFTRIPVAGDYPLTGEAMAEATQARPIDSAATISELGIGFRDRWSTLRDTYQWMVAQGWIGREAIGHLAIQPVDASVTAARIDLTQR